jgi:hypothetical protein
MDPLLSRRALVRSALGVLALVVPRRVSALGPSVHPTPREGITGAKVATADMLKGAPQLRTLFDDIRAIPHVVDGIRCHCGCAELDSHYSLLTCYEGANAMAMVCPICQGEGRVAVRMAKAGRSLADIRVAIDAQFG